MQVELWPIVRCWATNASVYTAIPALAVVGWHAKTGLLRPLPVYAFRLSVLTACLEFLSDDVTYLVHLVKPVLGGHPDTEECLALS